MFLLRSTLLLACASLFGGCPAGRQPAPRPGPAPTAMSPASAPTVRVSEPQTRAVLKQAGIPPDALRCNSYVYWERSLSRYAHEIVDEMAKKWGSDPDEAAKSWAHHHALGYLVRTYFNVARPHNLGAMRLAGMTFRDAQGKQRPLLIFRSGMTVTFAGSSDCFRDLVRRAGVRHVANLYGGTFPFDDMVAGEKALAQKLNVSYFDALTDQSLRWRPLVEHKQSYTKNLTEASRRLAKLIKDNLLRPGGQAPKGNLYIHCGGGMHRSGMLFGVLRRCINNDPMALIEKEYRRHVAYQSDDRPGGFEELNLQFIRDFDCSLLKEGK